MKKTAIYIGTLAIGLFLGWLIFGGNSTADPEHDHTTETAAQMYTCSMHPQIMQPEPGDCPICGMDLIPADAGADGLAVNQFRMSEQAVALANINTTVVGNNSGSTASLRLSGKIEANEKNTLVQAAYFGGRIESLNINTTGEQVRKGQLLATMYSPELVAAQQELLTASNLKEKQPGLYKAVRNKLKLWKLSEKQISEIETRGEVQEFFPVYATISGTVTEKLINEGDYVKQGQALYRIANLNSVWAVLDAYENQLSMLDEGQALTIKANAYPGRTFESTIEFIDPTLNNANRTTRVRAELKNNEGLLKPGMFIKADAQIEQQEETNRLLIPQSAVMWTGTRSVVYVQPDTQEAVFELREVELGGEMNDQYEVLAGLQNGERIVTQGTFTIDAAAQLQGKPSMMNREEKEEDNSNEELSLPKSFQKSLWPLLSAYMTMNESFVKTDPSGAKQQARKMLDIYETMDVSSLGASEKDLFEKAGQMITAIANNEEIEAQRSHLVILSDALVVLAKNMEELPETLYVQNCPMANQNKGADWLSTNEKILNPYYGDAMLSCGSTLDTLR
ncbi:efflux RND transporter periplasmic adaptor subunit [Robertkochia marina]|uniref:Efflux RND transporter periplasmic adaptor subunit n=1 Tax=Robertkochia marina TaxID=1227945 RepID=A0A4S3M0M4_9FLAO|nr:efflux RND transporter periplasmic adaptor subunit [Robertkochia marina]THD66493.1 efflux RND transporter periplasmic adaptor subunit [Robertkochia marina]TRZ45667.1 efflux RND transporter periplasmic adaptor subunit [Robertkochia marina]